jgi:hypothetical protein
MTERTMSPLPLVEAGAFCFLTHLQEAKFEDGILTLKLPKAEEVKPKVIKVKGK